MYKTAIFALGIALIGPEAYAQTKDNDSQPRTGNFAGKFYTGILLGREKTNFDFDLGRRADKAVNYGLVLGKNFVAPGPLFAGIEGAVQFFETKSTVPALTTLPVGFSSATIEKSRSLNLNLRAGFYAKDVAVYGLVGVSNSKFNYLVDNVPTAEFFGRGDSSLTVWGLNFGAGVEVPLPLLSIPMRLRGEFRRTTYREVSAEDLGLADADLGLLDLNSRHAASEFVAGLIISF